MEKELLLNAVSFGYTELLEKFLNFIGIAINFNETLNFFGVPLWVTDNLDLILLLVSILFIISLIKFLYKEVKLLVWIFKISFWIMKKILSPLKFLRGRLRKDYKKPPKQETIKQAFKIQKRTGKNESKKMRKEERKTRHQLKKERRKSKKKGVFIP